jgi:hypothetical protein
MSEQIPDLWPDGISVKVLSPVAILKAQGTKLAEKTKGLLEGEISGRDLWKEGRMLRAYDFDIVAPALSDYRHRVMSIYHEQDSVYPVSIEVDKPSRQWTAYTENQFFDGLSKVLGSDSLLATIQSLLARSNEALAAKEASTGG